MVFFPTIFKYCIHPYHTVYDCNQLLKYNLLGLHCWELKDLVPICN